MRRAAWIAVALGCLALPAAAQGAFEVEGYAPREGTFWVEGQECRGRYSGPAALATRLVYRPGSVHSEHDLLERDANGAFVVKPRQAGLAKLEAYDPAVLVNNEPKVVASKLISIAFASTFSSGLLVMLGAGLVLFGGAFLSVRALLRADSRSEG